MGQEREKLIEACQLLNIDTSNKTNDELNALFWQELTKSQSRQIQSLLKMVRDSQQHAIESQQHAIESQQHVKKLLELVNRYESQMNEQDQQIAFMISEALQQQPFDILQFLRMSRN